MAAWLSGAPRQGKLGAGWRTLSGVDAAPRRRADPHGDRRRGGLDELAAVAGSGSTARRAQLLAACSAPPPPTSSPSCCGCWGGLRHGALEGVVLDAVAAAADAPAPAVRRAFFLSGELPAVAELALTGASRRSRRCGWRSAARCGRCWPRPPDDLTAALGDGEVVVEQKMDGAGSRCTGTATTSVSGRAR